MILSFCLFYVFRNKDQITAGVLENIAIFVLAGPSDKFTENEFNVIKKYLESGGSILVMMAEGGEKTCQTNINFLLEEYGIMVNSGMLTTIINFKHIWQIQWDQVNLFFYSIAYYSHDTIKGYWYSRINQNIQNSKRIIVLINVLLQIM